MSFSTLFAVWVALLCGDNEKSRKWVKLLLAIGIGFNLSLTAILTWALAYHYDVSSRVVLEEGMVVKILVGSLLGYFELSIIVLMLTWAILFREKKVKA